MKAINQKAVKVFNQIRARAAKDGIRVTRAVEMVIEQVPDVTRAEIFHSAREAGVNGLTARNVFDRVNGK